MTTRPLPLNDFLVIDLTAHRAGPTAVRQLADWGAQVIKIEPSGELVDRRSVGSRLMRSGRLGPSVGSNRVGDRAERGFLGGSYL